MRNTIRGLSRFDPFARGMHATLYSRSHQFGRVVPLFGSQMQIQTPQHSRSGLLRVCFSSAPIAREDSVRQGSQRQVQMLQRSIRRGRLASRLSRDALHEFQGHSATSVKTQQLYSLAVNRVHTLTSPFFILYHFSKRIRGFGQILEHSGENLLR